MEHLDLQKIYKKRFGPDIEYRKRVWNVLCHDFFARYIPPNATLLEVAAGYGEFINAISAKRKIALDKNQETRFFLEGKTEFVCASSTAMVDVEDSSCDVVFVSNFFEHLSKEDIILTLREVCRVLKVGGRLLLLQPNIRLCGNDYWSFFDHLTPLDDKSLIEVLEMCGFTIIECRTRFLPFTIKSRFPRWLFLVRIYLRVPFLQYLFGKQTFIYAKKLLVPMTKDS
jgi:SAM-dependent methyltransferase